MSGDLTGLCLYINVGIFIKSYKLGLRLKIELKLKYFFRSSDENSLGGTPELSAHFPVTSPIRKTSLKTDTTSPNKVNSDNQLSPKQETTFNPMSNEAPAKSEIDNFQFSTPISTVPLKSRNVRFLESPETPVDKHPELNKSFNGSNDA